MTKKQLVLKRLKLKEVHPSAVTPEQLLKPQSILDVFFKMYPQDEIHSPRQWLHMVLIMYYANPATLDDFMIQILHKNMQPFSAKELKDIKREAKKIYFKLLKEQ